MTGSERFQLYNDDKGLGFQVGKGRRSFRGFPSEENKGFENRRLSRCQLKLLLAFEPHLSTALLFSPGETKKVI